MKRAIASAMTAYYRNFLFRGTQVQQDGYPYRVMRDMCIPTDPDKARNTKVPCTTITAYGDPTEEEEYKVMIPYGELTR